MLEKTLLFAFVLAFVILYALALPLYAQVAGESATVYGFVSDESNGDVSALEVQVSKEFFRGNSTQIDGNGSYAMHIPAGEFTLRILDESDNVLFQYRFNVSEGESLRLDFTINSSNIERSRIEGKVADGGIYGPIEGLRVVVIDRHNSSYSKTTITDHDGKFTFDVKAGEYSIAVYRDNQTIYDSDFTLEWGSEKRFDIEVKAPPPRLGAGDALQFVATKGMYVLAIVFVIVFLAIAWGFATKINEALDKRNYELLDRKTTQFIENSVKWTLVLVGVLCISFLLGQMSDYISVLIWKPLSSATPAIFTIVIILIAMNLSLRVVTSGIAYMKRRSKNKDEAGSTVRIMGFLEIGLKNFIVVVCIVFILVTALAALGMQDAIFGAILSFFVNDISFVGFIGALLVTAYSVDRILHAMLRDARTRSRHFTPEMMGMVERGIRGFTFIVVGLVLIFSVLSAVGLGDIGETLILVFSLVVGMVVSMAATGSIGNALSGLIVMAYKPFSNGDYIMFQGERCKIVEIGIIFTRVRNRDNAIIEIPNNLFLSSSVTNLTHSAKDGGYAIQIDVSIPSDVPFELVKRLMLASASGVSGVLETPIPKVTGMGFYDNAIGYRLRAYIDTPQDDNGIKTEIMKNMQRIFAENGVEILVPAYELEYDVPKDRLGHMKKLAGDISRAEHASIGPNRARQPSSENADCRAIPDIDV